MVKERVFDAFGLIAGTSFLISGILVSQSTIVKRRMLLLKMTTFKSQLLSQTIKYQLFVNRLCHSLLVFAV
jgi:hypothetical protein